ncbi:MAG: hypothetical protein NTU98_09420 [Bacteroidetes bacterium]|nr:hypothetical protein [Bacteroidota bacterium]
METDRKPVRIRVLMIFLLLIILIVAGYLWLPVGRLLHRSPLNEKEFVNQQQEDQSPNSVSFNFEPAPNTETPAGLYKGIAHSGSFSAKVFGINSYSPAIERKVSETGPGELKAIGVSAWVYIFPTKADITSDLILGISNKLGVNVIWKKVIVEGTRLPMGKWFKVSGFFDLADKEINADYRLQLFYWNNSKADILVDDFYMVFGTSPERKGDTTYVDMTLQKPFTAKLNTPPFPFIMAEKQEIGNHSSAFLVDDGKQKQGLISPDDRLFTRNFTGDNSGLDQLLVLNPGKKPELFVYSREKKAFSMISVNVDPSIQPFMDSPVILAGRFSSRSASELIFIKEKEILLAGFSKNVAGKEILMRPIRKTAMPFPVADLKKFQFLAPDINGDDISELFAAEADGTWHLFKFSEAGWEQVSSAEAHTVTEWMDEGGRISFFAGEFRPLPSWEETILAIMETQDHASVKYSLHVLDPVTGQFKRLFRYKQKLHDTLPGPDVLNPGDQILTGNFGMPGLFLKYNRDWRFDLKLLSFENSGYCIHGNVDFKGYEKDHNPKYFEILRIIPGCFIEPGKTSLLVIGRNCKKSDPGTGKCIEFDDRPELPNTIQVYALPYFSKND